MRNLLLSVCMMSSYIVGAQSILYFNWLAGTYAMTGPSNLQKEFISNLQSAGLAANGELKFPASIAGELGWDAFLGERKNLTLGVFLNNTITQGQAEYADYSGFYKFQQKVYRAVAGVRVS